MKLITRQFQVHPSLHELFMREIRTMSYQRSFTVFFFIGIGLALAGCANVRDISGNQVLPGGYAPGQTYVSNVELAILETGAPIAGFCLDRNRRGISDDHHGQPVLQVLPPGTRIRIDKILHVIVHAPIQGESWTTIVVSTIAARHYTPLLLSGGNSLSSWKIAIMSGWDTAYQEPNPRILTLESGDSQGK